MTSTTRSSARNSAIGDSALASALFRRAWLSLVGEMVCMPIYRSDTPDRSYFLSGGGPRRSTEPRESFVKSNLATCLFSQVRETPLAPPKIKRLRRVAAPLSVDDDPQIRRIDRATRSVREIDIGHILLSYTP
jgi:hypothetical protein